MTNYKSADILPENTNLVIILIRVPGGYLSPRFGWYERQYNSWYMCRDSKKPVHPVMWTDDIDLPDIKIKDGWIEKDNQQRKGAL